MTVPVRFASFLGDNALDFYAAVVAYLHVHMELDVQMCHPRARDPGSAFSAGEIDAGFICGLPYVLYEPSAHEPELALLAAPVLAGPRYADRPVYFADLIVRRDSSFHALDDLRGARFAFNEISSCSGFVLPRYHLVSRGSDLDFFGDLVETGSHAASMDAVETGGVDAAAIDSVVLEMEFRQRPAREQVFRVVHQFGPASMPPVVASRRLPPATRVALADALVNMDSDPDGRRLLRQAGVRRFHPVADADYDDIRAILTVLERRAVLASTQ